MPWSILLVFPFVKFTFSTDVVSLGFRLPPSRPPLRLLVSGVGVQLPVRLEVGLAVRALAVVRLQVQPRVVPGRAVAQVVGVVLGEAVLEGKGLKSQWRRGQGWNCRESVRSKQKVARCRISFVEASLTQNS